jgi:phage-related tail protein
MTNDEFERAKNSMRENQVKLEALCERVKEQLKEMTEGPDILADAEANILSIRANASETQARFNESLRAEVNELKTRQDRIEAAVDRLSQKVEALVKIVEEERNGGR